jgi:ubiquinone/menaquinone biosynthesis C-methylase UbiE
MRPGRETTDSTIGPVIEALQIDPDDVVIDLNSGTDRFALDMARRIDRLEGDGMVFALDHDDQMVDLLRDRISSAGSDLPVSALPLSHYRTDLLPFYGDTADRVLAVNHLASGGRRELALSEIYRVLRPGGLAMLVRWWPDGVLRPSRIDELRRDFDELDERMAAAGFAERARLYLSWDFLALRGVKPEPPAPDRTPA